MWGMQDLVVDLDADRPGNRDQVRAEDQAACVPLAALAPAGGPLVRLGPGEELGIP